MAPTEVDQFPFERMFDLQTIPVCPDSGDIDAADDINAAASDDCTCKPGGKSGEKRGEANAARKLLLAALMQALADSAADDTATAAADEPPSSPESLDDKEFLSSVALAAGSRKRKAAEIREVPSADAPVVGGSEEESEVTRQLRRAIAAVILRGSGAGGPCPAPASPDAPSPPAAASLPMVTTHAPNPVGRSIAHGPLPMPFRLPIANGAAPAAPSDAPALLAAMAAPEALACMNYYDNSHDDMMAGYSGIPGCGRGTNGAADHDADDWLPRNRGHKDRQMEGGRIKARSMAERQKWERICEGLQKLRLVVRGHGDTASMLDKAVTYVDALQRRLRQLKCELGVLRSADGSASFEMGNTKVLAVVYGPREVTNRADALPDRAVVRCEYGMASFSTGERRRRGKMDRRSVEISLVIRQTLEAAIMLELLPRTQIDIFVQVLQADGGTRSACINAATLALCHAGIPMRDLVTSCASGYLNATPLLDLNYVEDSGGGPDVTVGYLPSFDKISLLQMDAKLPMDTFEEVVKLAVTGCKAIAHRMRQVRFRGKEDVVGRVERTRE
ncbi:unnamed protein product [Closterium sp. NIES-64]|nr:unnamed protein product [Closterium sp. NIES-64]